MAVEAFFSPFFFERFLALQAFRFPCFTYFSFCNDFFGSPTSFDFPRFLSLFFGRAGKRAEVWGSFGCVPVLVVFLLIFARFFLAG